MGSDSVGYEIREGVAPAGGLLLELVVEGAIVARAQATADTLSDMFAVLGLSQDAVAEELRQALLKTLRSQEQFVEISNLMEEPGRPLRFSARFTQRFRDTVSTGRVWYDVNTSMTGPEELPAVVRNKLRFEVHRKLTGDGTAARALVDLHK